jgi:hypothetical protein
MDRKAGKCRVGGKTAGEKTTGEKTTGEKTTGEKTTGEKNTRGAVVAESGAGARGVSNADACARTPEESEPATRAETPPAAGDDPRWRGRDEHDHPCQWERQGSEAAVPADAASAVGDDQPRRRGCDEDGRQRGRTDLTFRALCGMGFRAREARRALESIERRRPGSPPGTIEALLREALAALAR